MKCLTVPVPETLTASYLIPLPAPSTAAKIGRRISEAAGSRLAAPYAEIVRRWIDNGVVTAEVLTPAETGESRVDLDEATNRQRALVRTAGAFVRISVTQPASIVAFHEWQARGCAAVLAADTDAPLIDESGGSVLSAHDALASLPDMSFEDQSSDNTRIRFSPHQWIRFHAFGYRGRYWAQSQGMDRFGLPEIFLGGAERDLREELRDITLCVAFRIWSDFAKRAEASPGSKGLFRTEARTIEIPAEMELRRKDLDSARGVPNRGGVSTTIGLRLEKAPNGHHWIAVVPPADWDMSWEDFINDMCHAMFGFEKPAWYYLPDFGALFAARESVPEAHRRFRDGALPPGGQLLVRYRKPEATLRWARVESWEDDGIAIVRDIGRELSPAVQPGAPVSVDASQVVDWAIWVDGEGVVEGASTECIS